MDIFETFLDKFKCTICKNLMQIPKSLPCGHDACEKCLQSYILRTVPMTGYDLLEYANNDKLRIKPSQKYFVCPAEGCDKKHNPVRPDKNVMYWAVDLDNNLQKIHLMELFKGKRKKDTKFCRVCVLSPTPELATVVCTSCCWLLCNKCTLIHSHVSPSHAIVDLVTFESGSELVNASKSESAVRNDTQREETAEAPERCLTDKIRAILENQTQHSKTDPQNFSGYKKLNICPIHRPCEEVLYCKDCDILCCIKCSDANHVTCKNVHSIQKVFKKMIDTRADETLKIKTEALVEKCSTRIGLYLEGKAKDIAEMQHETLTDISEVKERIFGLVRRYDYLYNRAKRCVNQMSIVDSLDANEFIKMMFSVEKEYLKLEDEFVKAVSNDSDVISMVEMVEQKWKSNKNKQVPSIVEKVPQETCMSDSDTDLLNNTFGEQKARATDATDKLEFETNILAKSGSDMNDCWLAKCILLQSMDIIVADRSNKKIKLISEVQKIYEVSLESVPLSIVVHEPDMECFVSLQSEQKVIVININRNELVICSEIHTEKEVFDIGILNSGTLLCVSNGPEPFHQLYRNGIMEEFEHQSQLDEKNREMYEKASHLKVVEHQGIIVYVSDCQKNVISSYRMFRGIEDNGSETEQRIKETERDHKTDTENHQIYSSFGEKIQIEYRDGDRESNSSKPHKNHKCRKGETLALNEKENGIIDKDDITYAGTMCSTGDTSSFSSDPQHEGILADVEDTNSISSSFEGSIELHTQNLPIDLRLDNVTNEGMDLGLKNSYAASIRLHKQTAIPNPTGFDLDSMGNIYVCCNSQCEVLKLGTEKKEMFKILDISSPIGISIHQDKMILTVDSGPRKNYVIVYRFK